MAHTKLVELTDLQLMHAPLDVLVKLWTALDRSGMSAYRQRVGRALVQRCSVDIPL